MRNVLLTTFFFCLILLSAKAQRSNITITAGATSNGSWSGSNGATFTFTPSGNNATINSGEIYARMYTNTGNVIINTLCSGCSQVGQIDLGVAITADMNGNNTRTLTLNAGGDLNVSQGINLSSTTNSNAYYNQHSLVLNSVNGNINVLAPISTQHIAVVNDGTQFGISYTATAGSVTMNALTGVISASSAGSITTSGVVNTTYGANYDGYAGAISLSARSISMASSLNATVRNSSYASNYNGNISISTTNPSVDAVNTGMSGVITGRNFTKAGVGVLKMSAANSYVGTSTIAAGTLQLGSGSSIPDVSDVSLTSGGSVLDMNGYSETINSLASTFTQSVVGSSGSSNYILTIGTGASGPATSGVVYNGILQDNIGSGSGLMSVVFNLYDPSYIAYLGGTNTHSGLTTITRGTLTITNGSALGKHNGNGGLGTVVSSSGSLYLGSNMSVGDEPLSLSGSANGGALYNNGVTSVWGGSISLAGASTIYNSGTLSLAPASGVAVSGNNVGLTVAGGGTATISGTVSLGSGGLTTSNGLVKLLVANSYSGATTVSSGSLNVQHSLALSTSAVSVSNGASLQLQGGISVGNTLNLAGIGVGNSGSLRSISGVNEYTGNITLSTSAVRINTDANALSISGNISAGLIPLYFGSSASAGTVTTSVSGVISGAGGSLTWGTSPTQLTLATSLVKDGNVLALVLSGVNSYTGATVLGSAANPNGGSGAGVLVLGASGVIDNSSQVVFNGGSLNTGGYSENVGSLSVLQDGGSIILGSASAHELRFAALGVLDYKSLSVSGWQGTAAASGTGGAIYVGSSAFFTRVQLDQFKFTYNSGVYSSTQLSSGELVPLLAGNTGFTNIRITAGATSNGSWSGANGATFTFTPSGNNATINSGEIYTRMYTNTGNVIINTVCSSCSQVGQIDLGVAITADMNGNNTRTLTLNAGGDLNVSQGINLSSTTNSNAYYNQHSLVLNSVSGNINVLAPISTQHIAVVNDGTQFGNSYTATAGSVTMNALTGVISASSAGSITTSGVVNTTYGANYDGYAGAISLSARSISMASGLNATVRNSSYASSYNGNILISTTNPSVDAENTGMSGVITGRNFTKAGVGVLKISATNSYVGTSTIAAGTLQLGSGSVIPDGSAVYFAGGNLNDGGFSETMGALYLSNSATITLGNAAHGLTFASAGTFAGTASTTVLTFVVNDGVEADFAINTFGNITNTSTDFVNLYGKKQNVAMGGLSTFGAVMYSQLGAAGNPIQVFIKSLLSTAQKNQIQFYKASNTTYYSISQKPVAGTNGEIITTTPK